jgi:uncharacterized 2Fe-2S/4Fe-4S cluster protein (DUF4445 family)
MASISHNGCARQTAAGKTLFDYADDLRVQVPSSCGRSGICHECIVAINRGAEALASRTEPEAFLQGDYRLACQATILNPDVDIEFALLRRRPQILMTSEAPDVELDPFVSRHADQVFYDGKLLDRYRGNLYGVAVDLGTTTVVVELVDLETGAVRCVSSFENPQQFGGSDVMHRISYDSGLFRGELRKAIVQAINKELQYICQTLGFARHSIYEIVVAGNATMRDIFFDLDVQSIGQRPYKSLTEHEWLAGARDTTSLVALAHKLGVWAHPKARVYGPPLIASHVGADTVCALIAIDAEAQQETFMLVDMGTNTEVVLWTPQRKIAASCPAGPAFEGGLVKYGMPGCDGAIQSLRLVDSRFEWRTIGEGDPEGICGSGLVDLLAELRRHGRMTPKGVFADRSFEMPVVPEHGITFSRADASNLAQAKAANYCGQLILMRQLGIGSHDISRLYLAGGFANYIDVRNAIDIGLLAPVSESRIVKIGNAALQGARRMLLSKRCRESAERLVRTIEHVELETTPDFFEVFVDGCQFKPMPEIIERLKPAAPTTGMSRGISGGMTREMK